MLAMYDCFNRHKQMPHLLHHEILGPSRDPKHPPLVLKPGMVEVAAEDAKRLAEWSLKEYHRPCFAGMAGLVGKTDREKMGRREYALMLVEHDLKRSKAYADERLYRYPDSEERAAEGESPFEQASSRNQKMLVGRFAGNDWPRAERYLPPVRPHHKPKIRRAIIRGRQVTIEEKRYVRR